MKNYNYAYDNLKKSANELKTLHWQQSGYLESSPKGNKQMSAQLVQLAYGRYADDWNRFIKNVKQDANQNKSNVQDVLQNYPMPTLPQETIDVGLGGEWQPLNLES